MSDPSFTNSATISLFTFLNNVPMGTSSIKSWAFFPSIFSSPPLTPFGAVNVFLQFYKIWSLWRVQLNFILELDMAERGDWRRSSEDDVSAIATVASGRTGKFICKNARKIDPPVSTISGLEKGELFRVFAPRKERAGQGLEHLYSDGDAVDEVFQIFIFRWFWRFQW